MCALGTIINHIWPDEVYQVPMRLPLLSAGLGKADQFNPQRGRRRASNGGLQGHMWRSDKECERPWNKGNQWHGLLVSQNSLGSLGNLLVVNRASSADYRLKVSNLPAKGSACTANRRQRAMRNAWFHLCCGLVYTSSSRRAKHLCYVRAELLGAGRKSCWPRPASATWAVLPVWGWSWWRWCCHRNASAGCVWSRSLCSPCGNKAHVTNK